MAYLTLPVADINRRKLSNDNSGEHATQERMICRLGKGLVAEEEARCQDCIPEFVSESLHRLLTRRQAIQKYHKLAILYQAHLSG